jgi:ADP-ribose pyrophosphatase YjhB (NUDIX family)
MAKKVRKIARASDLRQKHSRRRGKASTPDWGKAGAPPSPTIPSVDSLKDRPARRRSFIGNTGQPSPLLAELMASPEIAPPLEDGNPILEAGALACRRLKSGELSILLISKRRSGKWGIPKGRVNGRLTFGEVAAKEAFEEAGIKGCVSPNSIGMFRVTKRTPSREHSQIVEVWVYLMEVTDSLRRWPEKGKREIRWVPWETAARQLREPMLADLCQRLARGP